MNFTLEDNNLVISLVGQIRSNNADTVKKEIMSILECTILETRMQVKF